VDVPETRRRSARATNTLGGRGVEIILDANGTCSGALSRNNDITHLDVPNLPWVRNLNHRTRAVRICKLLASAHDDSRERLADNACVGRNVDGIGDFVDAGIEEGDIGGIRDLLEENIEGGSVVRYTITTGSEIACRKERRSWEIPILWLGALVIEVSGFESRRLGKGKVTTFHQAWAARCIHVTLNWSAEILDLMRNETCPSVTIVSNSAVGLTKEIGLSLWVGQHDRDILVDNVLNNQRAEAGGVARIPTGNHSSFDVDKLAVKQDHGADVPRRHVDANVAVDDLQRLVGPSPVPYLLDRCTAAVEGQVTHGVLLVAEASTILAADED